MNADMQRTDRRLAITFAWNVPSAGMVAETDERFAQSAFSGTELLDLEGQIRLDGGESVAIEDDLGYLAWRLCLDSIPDLRSGNRYEMKFCSRSGEVVLEPLGEQTRLLIAGEAAGVYPTAELIAELLACARRFAGALERFGAGNPPVQAASAGLVDRIVELEVG